MIRQSFFHPQNTKSGIAEMLYLARVRDMTNIAEPEPGTLEILDNHEFAPMKGFFKIALAPRKNSFSMQSQGDAGSSTLNQSLTFFVAGSYKSVHATFCDLVNEQVIALIKDGCSGQLFQLGDECVSAHLTIDFSTGTTQDGQKGYNATITWTNSEPVFYAGYIQTYLDYKSDQSPVFLLQLYRNKIDENNLPEEIEKALTDNIYSIYNKLAAEATHNLINIGLLTGSGIKRNDLLVVDLSSFATFKNDLDNYIDSYTVTEELVGASTRLLIESSGLNQPLMAIAIPGNMVDDGDGNILMLSDDEVLIIE